MFKIRIVIYFLSLWLNNVLIYRTLTKGMEQIDSGFGCSRAGERMRLCLIAINSSLSITVQTKDKKSHSKQIKWLQYY